MIPEENVKAYSLKIPKKMGNSAILITSDLGLLNKDLKIDLESDCLNIPLKNKPNSTQITRFQELSQFKIVKHRFTKRHKNSTKRGEDFIKKSFPLNVINLFPQSLDIIGQIGIVKIPVQLEHYKTAVGEAILKKNRQLRTILAKSGPVKGTHRLREYEIIAGPNKTETIHVENGCRYYLDPMKVYFSPRLSYEHRRVALEVHESETIVDMFAGVGTFSTLIARMKKNVKVYAIDINPKAFRYLKKNIRANRVQDKVTPLLGDSAKIIQSRFHGKVDRIIMNLPESSFDYLATSCQSIKSTGGIIHYYQFADSNTSPSSIKKHLSNEVQKVGRSIEKFLFSRKVREVAPFRWHIVMDLKIC